MKNKLEQMKSLKKALKNYKPIKKDDEKDEVEEDIGSAGGTSIGAGSVDMNPTGVKLPLGLARRKKFVEKFEPAFDKRHKNKKLLLTKFRQHAYGDN